MSTTSRKRTARRARSASRSSKDAIALLKEDHKYVKRLLKRLLGTTYRDTYKREDLLSEVENEVNVHTAIEEEIFYPAFKEAIRSRSDTHLYFEALEAHHAVELIMLEIKRTDAGSDEFGAKAKVLKDLIEHHSEEEETHMFPKARKAMGAARLRQLGEDLQERKHELTARPGQRRVA